MRFTRGTLLINAIGFVRERFGEDGHRKVRHALAQPFPQPLREASWVPLDLLVSYSERAKELLAPGEEDFFRGLGLYAGQNDRKGRAMGVMVADLETATKMAPTLWRQFFDSGELQVAERRPEGAILRIVDFPTTRSLCERITGSLEGLLTGAAGAVLVQKTLCVLDGSPYCEYRLSWPFPERE